jgi:hypothetical protein
VLGRDFPQLFQIMAGCQIMEMMVIGVIETWNFDKRIYWTIGFCEFFGYILNFQATFGSILFRDDRDIFFG